MKLEKRETSNMRVMLDSNIIISIAIFDSKNLKNMLTELCERHQLVLCSYIIDELNDVIAKKFPTKQKELDNFLLKIPYEIEYTPKNIPDIKALEMRDVKDKPILYSAITADVDILITGDKDFDNLDIEKPEIMTATRFLELYSK